MVMQEENHKSVIIQHDSEQENAAEVAVTTLKMAQTQGEKTYCNVWLDGINLIMQTSL